MTSHHVNRYVIMSICCAQKRRNQKSPFVICLVTNIVALVFNAIVSPSTYPSQSVSLQSLQICFLTSTTGFVDHSHLLCMPVRRPRKKIFSSVPKLPPSPPPHPLFHFCFVPPKESKSMWAWGPPPPRHTIWATFSPFIKCQNQFGQGVPAICTLPKIKYVFISYVVSHL